MELFIQTLVNGILIGGIYLIIAVGFSLSYGVMDIIDFAVGDWLMLGAFTAFWMNQYLHVDPLILLPLVGLIFAGIGYLVQPLLQKVINTKGKYAVLMALAFTFGLSTLFRGSALTLWGYNDRNMISWLSQKSLTLFGITFPFLRVGASIFALLVTLFFMFFLYKTKTGIMVRAASENKAIAGLMGVDSSKVGRWVYALYTALTGMAGVFVGMLFSVNPEMGVRYTAFAFFVVVAGGLGSFSGVIVASLVLGLISSFVAVYVGGTYIFLILFMMLYLILIFLPQGILGKGW